jgi:hypothetical protein
MRRIGPVLLGLLLLSQPLGARAQTWGVRAQVGAQPAAWIGVRGVPRDGGEVDAYARLARDPGLGAALRWSEAFGPLGTLVVEGDAEVRLGEPVAARASAGVRGTVGPVAARLRIGAHGASPERFEGGQADHDAPYDRGASLRLAVDGRASRTWLVSASATAWRDATGPLTYDLDAAARARSGLGRELDARLALQTRIGAGGTVLAVGLGAVYVPRRAPEVALTAWWDVDPGPGAAVRLRPGLEAAGAWRAGPDRVEAALVARPGGRARTPWSAELSWRRTLEDGDVTIVAIGHSGGPEGTGFEVRVGYQAPLDAGAR